MRRKLSSRVIKVEALSDSDIKKMFSLFSQYYENLEYQKFKQDMLKKTSVILLFNEEKEIKGFSTFVFFDETIGDKEITSIFSGDTVIDKKYWGLNVLKMAFFKVLVKHKIKNPKKDFYWYLITKGYKTYLLLANNFINYYPRYDKETPAFEYELINTLSKRLFGDVYQDKQMVLKTANLYDRLKIDVAPIEKKLLLENPKIAYFEKMNPGWQEGDELCCIGRVDLALASNFLLKSFKKVIS